jgi:hypothetical protein
MYPGPSARKFGSIGTETIGGGHKIAVFDDPVKGAAAQFDLLLRAYAGMPLGQAIAKWSGGNSSSAYASQIARQAGLSPDAVLTPEMLKDPALAVPLARGMAGWEAGKQSPLSDEQWRQAHSLATGGATPASSPTPMPATETPVDPVSMLMALFQQGGGTAPGAGTPPVGGDAAGGLKLPFGLGSVTGGQAKDLPDPMAGAGQMQTPNLLGGQRSPMDMQALMQLAATKRRGGIG